MKPQTIKEALKKANYADARTEIRLAFVIGFLSGSRNVAAAHERGRATVKRVANMIAEESSKLIGEFESKLSDEIDEVQSRQRN